jgi:hypothetical protein
VFSPRRRDLWCGTEEERVSAVGGGLVGWLVGRVSSMVGMYTLLAAGSAGPVVGIAVAQITGSVARNVNHSWLKGTK